MLDILLNNRYKVLDEIGHGSITTVYEAVDTLLDRKVAVKVLHGNLATPDVLESFHRIAKRLSELSHPYIANTYASYRDGEINYIVQELLPRNLKSLTEAGVSPNEAVRIGIQICEALKYADKAGMTHGHILPQNILLDDEGVVKISDFMLYTSIRSLSRGITLALPNAFYISPEQVKGDASTATADIYSAGAVLYHLIAARPPFKGDTAIKVAYGHLHEAPLSLAYIAKGVDARTNDVIAKALQKEPSKRYRQADAFLRELRDLHMSFARSEEGSSPAVTRGSVSSAFSREEDGTEAEGTGYRNFKPLKRRKGAPVTLRLTLLAALLLFLLAITGKLPIFPREVVVPEVEGKTVAEAVSILEDTGLRLKVATERYDDEAPAGTIISAEPEAGRTVRENRVIYVIVSKGAETVIVPDLYNLPYEHASRILAELGLKVGRREERPDSMVKSGYVTSQSPYPDTAVAKGSGVTLIISKGSDEAEGSLDNGQRPRKYATVRIPVPDDDRRHRVKIVVIDDDGERVFTDRLCESGELVEQDISGYGKMTAAVYLDEKLIREEAF